MANQYKYVCETIWHFVDSYAELYDSLMEDAAHRENIDWDNNLSRFEFGAYLLFQLNSFLLDAKQDRFAGGTLMEYCMSALDRCFEAKVSSSTTCSKVIEARFLDYGGEIKKGMSRVDFIPQWIETLWLNLKSSICQGKLETNPPVIIADFWGSIHMESELARLHTPIVGEFWHCIGALLSSTNNLMDIDLNHVTTIFDTAQDSFRKSTGNA